jgi:hypothetical protein
MANLLRNWQNVFQTADLNSGIRYEIDKYGNTGLIVATDNGSAYLVVQGRTKLVVGKQEIVKIKLTEKKGISLQIGNDSSTQITGKIMPACNNLRFGVGYDNTRQFSGLGTVTLEAGFSHSQVPSFPHELIIGQTIVVLSFALLFRGLMRLKDDQ